MSTSIHAGPPLSGNPNPGKGDDLRRREAHSPDERHHLLHDVLAEGDDDKEFLWKDKTGLVQAAGPGRAPEQLRKQLWGTSDSERLLRL